MRYTNPVTGKRLLNRETEESYKGIDKTFYAIKENEDNLMSRLRQIEIESDAADQRSRSSEEDEEEVEEEDSEPKALLEFEDWKELHGSSDMPDDIAEMRYMDYARIYAYDLPSTMAKDENSSSYEEEQEDCKYWFMC